PGYSRAAADQFEPESKETMTTKRKIIGVVVGMVLASGVGIWVERASLLAWLHVRGLARAGEGDRERWAERVANLGEAAAPALLGVLEVPDAAACYNARVALDHLAARWGLDDSRTENLVDRL